MKGFLVCLLCAVLLTPAFAARRRWVPIIASAAGPAPAYSAKIGTFQVNNNSGTSVITLTAGATSGQRVVLACFCSANVQTVASVADSKGNTYTIDKQDNISPLTTAVVSAPVTTPLITGDTVTITWGGTIGTRVKAATVVTVNNSTAVDVTGSGSGTGTAVSAAATTTTATASIGAVAMWKFNGGETYTPGSGWTAVDNPTAGQGYFENFYAVQQNFSSSGSKDVGGTISSSSQWVVSWVAYK